MSINDILRRLPRDGRRRYHVQLKDGTILIVFVGPGTMSFPPSLDGPWSRFELQVKPGKEGPDIFLEPHFDNRGRLGYALASGVDYIAERYGGYLAF